MNISQEKVDDLNALLKVEILEADYSKNLDNALKKQQKKASMPGFRPGKIPFGMIKKMYGTSIKVDEVNKLIGEKITDYITNEKLNLLGQPIPVQNLDLDWENQKDFILKYEMGLSPEFELKLSDKDQFTYYKVVPSNELIDNYVEELTMRFGKVSNPLTIGEKDLISIDITELSGEEIKEGGYAGIVTVAVNKITNDKIKDLLLDKKQGEKTKLNIKELGKTISESAQILNHKIEDLQDLGNEFEVIIGTISRMEAASLDQDLFDKVYGKDTVNSIDEFRNKVKEEASGMIGDQGKSKLKGDLIDYLLNTLNFNLPDEFMKKWLVLSSDGKLTTEAINADYENYRKSIKWQVIENKLIQENNITVEPKEVVEKAKEMIAANFKQYGQQVEDEQLTAYANSILKKEEERRRLYDDLYYDKIIDLITEKCKVEEKEIAYEEFTKMINHHHEHEHVHDENCNHDHDHSHSHTHAHSH